VPFTRRCRPLKRPRNPEQRKIPTTTSHSSGRFAESLKSGTTSWSDWAKLSKESPEAGLRNTIEPIASLAGRLADTDGCMPTCGSYLEQIFNLAAKALDSYHKISRKWAHSTLPTRNTCF